MMCAEELEGAVVHDPSDPAFNHFVTTGALFARKRTPLGPYCRPLPRVVGGSSGGGRVFLWTFRPGFQPLRHCRQTSFFFFITLELRVECYTSL